MMPLLLGLTLMSADVKTGTPAGATVLRNDFGTFGWGGPCPPPGSVHHYTFTLLALGRDSRILATAKLVPVYKR